jgi:hypothetical protein
MKKSSSKSLFVLFSIVLCSIQFTMAQNINIPENWIHADSLRVRSIHVGDSSIFIGTLMAGTLNNVISTTTGSLFLEPINGTLNLAKLNPNQGDCNFNIGTNANTYKLHLHDGTNASNTVNPFIHFTNTPTGQLTTDGFAVGISSVGDADFIQKEQRPMRFYTANNASGAITLRMFIQTNNTANDGFVAIGNGFSTPAYRLDVNDNINVNSNTATSTTTNFINAGYRIGGNLVLAVPNDKR